MPPYVLVQSTVNPQYGLAVTGTSQHPVILSVAKNPSCKKRMDPSVISFPQDDTQKRKINC
jgi:hypothetical protein